MSQIKRALRWEVFLLLFYRHFYFFSFSPPPPPSPPPHTHIFLDRSLKFFFISFFFHSWNKKRQHKKKRQSHLNFSPFFCHSLCAFVMQKRKKEQSDVSIMPRWVKKSRNFEIKRADMETVAINLNLEMKGWVHDLFMFILHPHSHCDFLNSTKKSKIIYIESANCRNMKNSFRESKWKARNKKKIIISSYHMPQSFNE